MTGDKQSQTPLAEAFQRAVQVLTEAHADYALIGGFAVAHHGLPRPTRDIDLILKVPRILLPGLLERFADQGFDFDLREVLQELRDDRLSAIRYRTVRVDLLAAVVPLFTRTVERALTIQISGLQVKVARAEDLIVLKVLAAREGDLGDVKGILATQGDKVDFEEIRKTLRECSEPETLALFERLARESG